MRRHSIMSVLEDGMLDREEYLQAVAGNPKWEAATRLEIEGYKQLLDRYRAGRVVLSEDDCKVVRGACQSALLWRRGLLDANSNSTDRTYLRSLRAVVAEAKKVFEFAGGVFKPFEGRLVSLKEIAEQNLGTCIDEVRKDGHVTRKISENGVPLGVIEQGSDGIVRVTLADGKIVNQPFEGIAQAQEWLLGKFSNNLVFKRDEDDLDPDFGVDPVPGP